jgi:hypothetical protein
MCICDPHCRTPYCGKGDCTKEAYYTKIQNRTDSDWAGIYAPLGCVLPVPQIPARDQWEMLIPTLRLMGLSIIKTKELEKLEKFKGSVQAALYISK